MFKKHIVKFMVAFALLVAVSGSNAVRGAFGIEAVPSVQAGDCTTGGGGGSC